MADKYSFGFTLLFVISDIFHKTTAFCNITVRSDDNPLFMEDVRCDESCCERGTVSSKCCLGTDEGIGLLGLLGVAAVVVVICVLYCYVKRRCNQQRQTIRSRITTPPPTTSIATADVVAPAGTTQETTYSSSIHQVDMPSNPSYTSMTPAPPCDNKFKDPPPSYESVMNSS